MKTKKKKSKKRKLPKTTKIEAGQFVELGGGMIVGEVPLKKLRIRKDRFRRMDSLQLEALQDSVSRLGMKDPITVIPNAKGGWDIIDGHHRVDELSNQGYKKAAVIVLTDADGKLVTPAEADLSMHRLNVSAHYDGDIFLKVLHEMVEDGIDTTDIAKATAKEVETIEELIGAFKADLGDDDEEDEDEEEDEEDESRYDSASAYGAAERDKPTHESSRGVPIILTLPGSDEVRELLATAKETYDTTTNAEAVVEALRTVFKTEE